MDDIRSDSTTATQTYAVPGSDSHGPALANPRLSEAINTERNIDISGNVIGSRNELSRIGIGEVHIGCTTNIRNNKTSEDNTSLLLSIANFYAPTMTPELASVIVERDRREIEYAKVMAPEQDLKPKQEEQGC